MPSASPADLGDHLISRLGLRNVGEAKVVGDMSERTPAIVLGGTGYVAGELLRLIAGHPQLEVAGHFVRQSAGSRGGRRVSAFALRLSRPRVRQPATRSRR